MKLHERIRGTVRVEILGAFPEALLNSCAQQGISLRELERVDDFALRATVRQKELAALETAARRSMVELRELDRRGGSVDRRFLRRRLGLLASAAAVAAALFISSLFIWELEVVGCERLSQGQVLRALADCGVKRGCYWPALSPDLLRSQMLTRMPELGWMTVNVSGSRAVVLVSERVEKPEIYREEEPRDLVASKTGIVRRMSVLNGQAQVSPGQSVTAGELLVSAAMESITAPPRQVCARGEVLADTWYEITAVAPRQERKKARVRRSKSRFALKIGGRRINLFLSGEKMLDGYDKIVHEYSMGVEGLFALPLSLVREDWILWRLEEAECQGAAEMGGRLRMDLQESIDGEVVSGRVLLSHTAELLRATLIAQCRENIALGRSPENTGAPPNGRGAP